MNLSPPLMSSSWQRIPFFAGVPSAALKQLLAGAEMISTKPKDEIFCQGDTADHFGFVVEGVFRLFRFDRLKQRVIVDFVAPGGLIGGLPMTAEAAVHEETAQSIEAGKFLLIPRQTYKDFWKSNPEIMNRVQIAAHERFQALLLMREAQRFSLEEKVAWVLLTLLSKLADENQLLRTVFSRADIGDAIGAAPESIIRTFSQWTKEELIEKRNGIEQINLRKLKKRYFEDRSPS